MLNNQNDSKHELSRTSFVHGLRFCFLLLSGFPFAGSFVNSDVTMGLHFSMKSLPIVKTFTKVGLLDDAKGEPDGFRSPEIEFMIPSCQIQNIARAFRANSETEDAKRLL
jgi:hypothetical protein